ncbi:hypothetical protein [Kribbella sp. HUAS MG21]|uniref:Uncharacterized protein n=1 Tax=Kribbella sp. HUAS MG21 TaxID=3160966 RepID=A0AAU7TA44_9ACTN
MYDLQFLRGPRARWSTARAPAGRRSTGDRGSVTATCLGPLGRGCQQGRDLLVGFERRGGQVPCNDHRYLFNYFYTDDRDTLLKVWEYTAGWFQANTALPNSALMRPVDGEPADYGLINHASWPTWRTFLPSLIFRRSYRPFVLANFKANAVAAQPTIYRLMRASR